MEISKPKFFPRIKTSPILSHAISSILSVCLSNIQPILRRYLTKGKIVDEHVHACQVCVQKVSFSIYVIPWDLIYICVCHKVRPSPRAIVTNVSRSVTCQIGKHSYRESTGKVSFFVDATFRYLTKLACYQRQKIPPIPSAASENCDSVYLRYIHDKLLRNIKEYLYINEIREYFDENETLN